MIWFTMISGETSIKSTVIKFSGWTHMVLNKQNIVLGVKSSLQSHHRVQNRTVDP